MSTSRGSDASRPAAASRRTAAAGRAAPGVGCAYVHSAVGDHSRLAYSEALGEERTPTVLGSWRRALAWYAAHGATARAVLSDNGRTSRSPDFARACAALGVRRRFTRPYRPRTNGKAERFNRTLFEEWACVRVYRSEHARTAALARALHRYTIATTPPSAACLWSAVSLTSRNSTPSYTRWSHRSSCITRGAFKGVYRR